MAPLVDCAASCSSCGRKVTPMFRLSDTVFKCPECHSAKKKHYESAFQYVPDITGSSPLITAGPIDHPAHYNAGKIEVIDFIEDQGLGFHLGNVIKYLSRAGKKNKETEIEDLHKAQWYLKRRITQLEKERGIPK